MFTVENSAQGNCMYEAYSISLMYFLRAKNNSQITDTVLNKFGLTEEEKNQLIPLITENRDQKFSRESIRNIIEPVLATKARALGARQTREDFINRPLTTGLYTSAQYGLEYFFKFGLREYPESHFLTSDFTIRDYTEAEIYKVANIKNTMLAFALEKSEEVHAKFEAEWAKIKDTVEPRDVSFRKGRVLDEIIAEKTIEFFSANNYRNLDAYISRLATNYVWGTEETLLTINRAVQGEHFVRNDQDRVDTYYDTVINLQIRVNGRAPDYAQAEQPDLILNNSNNIHWNSLIPLYISNPEQAQLAAEQEQLAQQPISLMPDEPITHESQDLLDAESKQILNDEELARQIERLELETLRQIEFDRQIAEQMKADDLAVAEQMNHLLEQDRLLAEQIQTEELDAKAQLVLEMQQDELLAQQISEKEQQAKAQMELVPHHDEDLPLHSPDGEDLDSAQRDLLVQQDAHLAQQVFEEEQQANLAAHQVAHEVSRLNEQMDLITQPVPAINATNAKAQAANTKFESLMAEFGKKVADLNQRAINAVRSGDITQAESLRTAHGVAETLLENLVSAKSAYDVNPNKESYQHFKTQCVASIDQARPELERHRGLKQLLGNIVLAVIGLGVVYLAAAALNKAVTGNFLFFKTNTAKIVDEIKSNVDEFEPTQPNPK
ncbi:Dot/Icm T4SS effector [Legionella moravica]|uniref:Dot/Icm T4SS effector n=1 Tax=Legionella moravica TaxID=39962 RepID=A0A378JU50_9GAMM|nr:hypothetical protein [Legionella moravica]KTD31655.1 Dot/Icm T4SS effector [Legionella moravica]STX62265.1 Dot/Icm T4SS effector [Legionella moravica]